MAIACLFLHPRSAFM